MHPDLPATPNPRDGLVARGLGRGMAIGGLTLVVAYSFGGLLDDGWHGALAGFLLGLMGSPVAATAGLLIALVPTLLMAWRWDYFAGHDSAARLCAISVCLPLTIAAAVYTAVHWSGSATPEAIVLVPLTLALVLGANSTDFVLKGTGNVWGISRLSRRRPVDR